MPDIRVQNLKKPVDVSEYIFTRLYQCGVRSVHGLPGDFNLVALDYLPKCGLTWVGSANELNAAYAADGYARVKGMGAIVTTFGVGELSALNGIAGAYSEMVPVVHLVGSPSTISQKKGQLLHHTLGNGNFQVFADMSANISCEVAKLNDPSEIAAQVDHALRECYLESRPVYLMLPSDMAQAKVEGARLDTPIDMTEDLNDTEKEEYVVDVILKSMHEAKQPVILVDACAIRHRVLPELHDLIMKTKLPVFVTPMGKGAVNEEHETYGGVYAGSATQPDVKAMVEGSDCVLSIGALKSDFNTAGFSYKMSTLNVIELHSTWTVVRYSEYSGVRMKGVLRKLVERVDLTKLTVVPAPRTFLKSEMKAGEEKDVITQAYFWPRISTFLKENDVVVTETGTSNFGIWDTKFPRGATGVSQVFWGSIGWALPACQGSALAVKDMGNGRRTLLFQGDGSFQLTVQELSTMIRRQLNVTIFLICNDGYTIERFIHGWDEEYNDVPFWQYKDLVTVFGGKPENSAKYAVHDKGELEALLNNKTFQDFVGVQFVEVYMPRDDAPSGLKLTAEASAKNNAKTE